MLANFDKLADVRGSNFVWSWRPLAHGWFRRLKVNSSLIGFDPRLGLDGDRLRAALSGAAEEREDWLIHPALSLLTDPLSELPPTLGRQLLLAAWTAGNARLDLGWVQTPCELLFWTPAGPRLLAPGRHDLAELGLELTASSSGFPVALDAFAATLDGLVEDCWSSEDDDPAQAEQDRRHICDFLGLTALLARRLPQVADWASRVTQVVIPFRSPAPEGFRSSSAAEFPGLIRMDIGYGALRILECLLHESAHRYFYHCETEQPFVEDLFVDRVFPSPLKPRPRPLRSVMLAYHALAYIVAGFAEVADLGLFGRPGALDEELKALRRATLDAQETCFEAATLLTDNGFAFLENTRRVADHGLAW